MPSRGPSTDTPTTAQQEAGRIAELRAVHAALPYLHNQEVEFRRWKLELARVPGPPVGEAARSEWWRQQFFRLGLYQVRTDELGNVFGLLQESPSSPLIAVSAHLDTVFPPETRLDSREDGNKLLGPGISDNAAGVVAMLAVASALRHSGIEPLLNVVFMGNVGEEGEGNLR